jgi:hypothetical protein
MLIVPTRFRASSTALSVSFVIASTELLTSLIVIAFRRPACVNGSGFSFNAAASHSIIHRCALVVVRSHARQNSPPNQRNGESFAITGGTEPVASSFASSGDVPTEYRNVLM